MSLDKFASALAAVALAAAAPVMAHAGTFTTLYSFAGGNTDGSSPQDTLTYKNGKLYGTTERGGPNDAGTVFAFDLKSGTNTVITTAMGSLPFTPVTFDVEKIYGTTSAANNGDGNIYSINLANGMVQNLVAFPQGQSQALPSGLTRLGATLYGTTSNGGSFNMGAIFSYSPHAKTAASLYSFGGGSDGNQPDGLLDHKGMLYGVTLRGGANGDGTLFMFNPATNTKTILHSFAGAADGNYPNGFAFSQNMIYGTALFGGANNQGTLFKIDPATGAATLLYSFIGGATGCVPFGKPAIYEGHIYGATSSCGDTANQGTLFDYGIASGKLKILHVFSNGPDGVSPLGSLTLNNGVIYGTTAFGGANNGGTIFEYAP
jgi:uncharacterized repeat protein (TIGR03803 family)